MRVFYQQKRPIYFHTLTEVVRYLKDETLQVSGQIGDICGIFGFPSGSFSSKGLKYDGHHFPLTFGFSESVANEFAADTAILSINGEALFIKTQGKSLCDKGHSNSKNNI